jgi:hypothetical protein
MTSFEARNSVYPLRSSEEARRIPEMLDTYFAVEEGMVQ